MAERKVLNKYINPDFDPSAIPKQKRASNLPASSKQNKVRMMLAMNICCKTCGHYMYAGTKFNTRQEKAQGEDYLGMPIHRFYMRCKMCSAEISIKTDPKNTDYVVENGATRNYEPIKEERKQLEAGAEDLQAQEEQDAMKALESKANSSKRQQEILSNLEELKAQQAQKHRVTEDDVLAALHDRAESEEQNRARLEKEEEDRAVQEAFRHASCSADDGISTDEPPSKRARTASGVDTSTSTTSHTHEKETNKDDEPRRIAVRSAAKRSMPGVRPTARPDVAPSIAKQKDAAASGFGEHAQQRHPSLGSECARNQMQHGDEQPDALAGLLAEYGGSSSSDNE